MNIGESFVSERKEMQDSVTGRKIIQLTHGDCFDYPMYYYIPTQSSDNKNIVFYRYDGNEVQHYKIEVDTGVTTKLTNAKTPNCLWRPWNFENQASGVRDLMSAFNIITNELLYFDNNDLHSININSLSDRIVYRLPDDRVPCSLTGVSFDGKWFCFAHVEAEQWLRHVVDGPARTDLTGVKIEALEIETGTTRALVEVNHWITHTNFYDHEKVLFCHAANEHAILLTDLEGGYYKHLRTIRNGMLPCHYQTTERGILYEIITGTDTGCIGMCDPDSNRCVEYRTEKPVYHVGYDIEGKLWFHSGGNIIAYFPVLKTGEINESIALTGLIETYSKGQRSHLHPAITNDRQSILYTGGDPVYKTNHLFLLDISDLNDTKTLLNGY